MHLYLGSSMEGSNQSNGCSLKSFICYSNCSNFFLEDCYFQGDVWSCFIDNIDNMHNILLMCYVYHKNQISVYRNC